MAFKETPRFPDDIAAGSMFGPRWQTKVVRNLAGVEFRNQDWTFPLYEGDLISGCKTESQWQDLLAFFHSVAGMFDGFRFKNYNDFEATGSQGTLVQIDSTHWQLYKTYTIGAISKARKITKPISGASIAGGGSYSLDTTTGIITKNSGSNPTGWTGEFDFPVRFNLDTMLPAWITNELYEIESIPIIEIRT